MLAYSWWPPNGVTARNVHWRYDQQEQFLQVLTCEEIQPVKYSIFSRKWKIKGWMQISISYSFLSVRPLHLARCSLGVSMISALQRSMLCFWTPPVFIHHSRIQEDKVLQENEENICSWEQKNEAAKQFFLNICWTNRRDGRTKFSLWLESTRWD